MRIDPRANHSGSRVPLNGSILLPPALYSNGVPSNLEVSVLGSVRLCMSMYMYVLLWLYLTLIRLLLTYLLTSYGDDNKI